MNSWEVVCLRAVAWVQLFARAGNEWLGSGMSVGCSMGPTVC